MNKLRQIHWGPILRSGRRDTVALVNRIGAIAFVSQGHCIATVNADSVFHEQVLTTLKRQFLDSWLDCLLRIKRSVVVITTNQHNKCNQQQIRFDFHDSKFLHVFRELFKMLFVPENFMQSKSAPIEKVKTKSSFAIFAVEGN